MTALAAVVLIVGFASVAAAISSGLARRELRAIAVRNVRRRPGRALLVATGVLLATATLASAAVIGDSLRTSIRRSAFAQLGPVDEEVIGSGPDTAHSVTAALARSRVAGIDGVLSFETLPATVRGRDFVPRVAQAQVIELDFARAAGFGGDPSVTGISGPTPSGDSAVMSVDLSRQIAIGSGHRVTIYAFGTSRTFRIARVLPRIGLAGLESTRAFVGSASLNLFVPLGTIESMRNQGHPRGGAATPAVVVAVSNRGGVFTSRQSADVVTAALRRATEGLAVEVLPVKELLLDDAARSADQFGGIFGVFGAFSVLGGFLLLLLTFAALAFERARSLGVLRALGLPPRDVAATLVLEGLCCCLLGAAVGAAVGIGIAAAVVIAARSVLANAAGGGIELVLSVRLASYVPPAAVGLLVSWGLLALTAALVSHRQVVALLRGEAGTRRRSVRRRQRVVGVVVCGTAITIAIAGVLTTNIVAALLGAAGAITGAGIASAARYRPAVTVLGATTLLIWTVIEVGTNARAGSGPAPVTLVTAAATMSLAAVTLVSVTHRAVAQRHRTAGRRHTAPFALGVAYAHATPARTAVISAMYAVVAFTVCLVATVAHVYAGNIDTVARELGGHAQLEVTSNPAEPVNPLDVAQLPGVTRVTGASALDAHLLAAGPQPFSDVTLIGVAPSLIDHGTPPITLGAPDLKRSTVYQQIASNPHLVVVGADLRTTAQNSLDHRAPHVGDTLQLADPTTGHVAAVRIAALAADARYEGVDHIYVSDTLLRALHEGPVARNVLYVETAPGTNNDTVAAIIDGTHLPNGTYARSFRRLARDRLGAQQQFLNVLAAYAALGLISGILALAVAMTDRVRERRQQLAMLRAIGLRPKTLRRALRVEATLISLEGTLAGTLTATVLAWRLTTTGAFADSRTFTPPWAALATIFAAVFVSACAATTAAARRTARLQPARALRADE